MNAATSTIRRLPFSSGSAAAEMAAASALLHGLEQTNTPALRWYTFEAPALVLGSSQRLTEVDMAASAKQSISIHRRRSGGGAVLGDANMVMLDLALPVGHPLYREDVTESYRWIGDVWTAALHDLGLNSWPISVAEARSDTAMLDPLVKRVCFGGRSPYEPMVDQRKIVGLAQIRRRGGALYQIGVHLVWSPQRNADLIAASEAEREHLAQLLGQRVAGLSDVLPNPPAFETVIELFESALTRLTGMTIVDDDWLEVERAAQQSELPRYAAIATTEDRRPLQG